MRIVIVTEYYRPWPGGISEHVHHEAVELRRRGHHVSILTGPATEGWVDEDVDVLRTSREIVFTSNGALSRMAMGQMLINLRGTLRRGGYDVVHVHAPMDPTLGWAALAASEVATVGTFHANFSPGLLWDGLFRLGRPLTGRLWRRLHGRIAVAEEARRSIAHYFPGDYEIIPNGVDTERFRPDISRVPAYDDGRKNILFVGRSDPRKGLPILLEAFRSVRAKVPGVRLIVVGPKAEELDPLLQPLSADERKDVCHAGYVPAEEMPHYFATGDVFCSSATGQESQGIVLLEAMASGRPPVAFAIPGYRDVVNHDRDGILVDPVGPESLASALADILVQQDKLDELGRNGRDTALRYAWPRIAERIESVFERSIDLARRR